MLFFNMQIKYSVFDEFRKEQCSPLIPMFLSGFNAIKGALYCHSRQLLKSQRQLSEIETINKFGVAIVEEVNFCFLVNNLIDSCSIEHTILGFSCTEETNNRLSYQSVSACWITVQISEAHSLADWNSSAYRWVWIQNFQGSQYAVQRPHVMCYVWDFLWKRPVCSL